MTRSENRLKNQPKYKIGQVVKVSVTTEHKETEIKFVNELEGYISVIKADGTSEKDTYQYGVTIDLPGCYHNGKSPFTFVYEDEIILK
jgi:hypothetical protein